MSQFQRLASVLDIPRMNSSSVAILGAGASGHLAEELARMGVGTIHLYDRECVETVNLGRQTFVATDVGKPKADAMAARLRQVQPLVEVTAICGDLLESSDEEFDRIFCGVDLCVVAVDNFRVQARANEAALRTGTPTIWTGVGEGAVWGEVIVWYPGIDSCFRCLVAKRYAAHEEAIARGGHFDPPSDGVTLSDIAIVDSIAVQLVAGILQQGRDNRFGRLLPALGDRTYLRIALRPEDLRPRELLQVPADNDRYFSWCTVARRDPSPEPCPDCERFRGHRFILDSETGAYQRVRPTTQSTAPMAETADTL